MHIKKYEFDDTIDIVVLGDLHLGDKSFTKESARKLNRAIDYVRDNKNAYLFLNGDILNTATRQSKTTPFGQDMDLKDQIGYAVSTFLPVKDKILGATTGNHECRIEDFAGLNPTTVLCYELGTPYMGYTGVLVIKLGRKSSKTKNSSCRSLYTITLAHTTGGGNTPGSKINRVELMRQTTVTNSDVYCANHNHMLGAVPVLSYEVSVNKAIITKREQWLVDCGSLLDWEDAYPEAKQLKPALLGFPVIRLHKAHEKKVEVFLNKV